MVAQAAILAVFVFAQVMVVRMIRATHRQMMRDVHESLRLSIRRLELELGLAEGAEPTADGWEPPVGPNGGQYSAFLRSE